MKSRPYFLIPHHNYLLPLLLTYTFKNFVRGFHLVIEPNSLFLHTLAYKGNKHPVQRYQKYNESSGKKML